MRMLARRKSGTLLLLLILLLERSICGISPITKYVLPATCIAGGLCVSTCLKVVTSGDECLVERLGRYHRRLGPGWHWIWKPFETVSFHVTIREFVMDVPPQQCYTLDNAPIQADAVVFLKITNVEAARYNVEDVNNAIMNLCLTQLREEVGKLTLDETFSSRERINKELLKDLNEVCQQWGVMITRVELQNLKPSPDIQVAMELQMAAERKKRAAILKSEGERMTMINEAEGRATAATTDAEAKRKATILLAQAESERQRVEAEGLKVAIQTVAGAFENTEDDGEQAAVQFLSLIRYMETQAKFAGSNGTKVIMLPSKDSLPLTYGGLKFLLD
mmetsp:Transcript_30319/g.34565  ORF Transcript_30319/g.34565 Transcript_30319/m.34565 type:complete len:334 (+) Transcript_30319:22-1023(+)